MTWVELRTLLTIFIMLMVPGWAILSVTNLWRRFEAIERWILAVGLSIAFYPFVYYLTRAILPSVRIGQNKLIVLLAGLFALTAWTLRKNWREQFKLGKYAGPFLFILALTLLTRFWLAHNYPYPAWTDSLHHMLITDLVRHNWQAPVRPSTVRADHFGPVSPGTLRAHWQPAGACGIFPLIKHSCGWRRLSTVYAVWESSFSCRRGSLLWQVLQAWL